MRRSSVIATIATTTALVTITADGAEARLDLYVDKSTQQLSVIQNGAVLYVLPVSTGHDRFSAPNGIYAPERLERMWFSRAYYNSPMPYTIFFHNGYAIHGSDDITRLGGPASRGCVRLHPRDAARLFAMVEQEGPGNTTIVVGDDARRPPLRYRNFDDAVQPPFRDERMPPGLHPPPGPVPPPNSGPARYPEGAGAYPPGPNPAPYSDMRVPSRDLPPPPHYDGDAYADGRGPGLRPDYPDYNADPYAGRRGDPYDPRIPADYADPYRDGRGVMRSPHVPPDHVPPDHVPPDRAPPDRYADGRSGPPPGLRVPPDHVDPYGERRGGPYGPYVTAPYPPPDRYGDGRSGDPRGPWGPPYGDGPAPPRGDQTTTRGNYPANRLPPPRPDRTVSAELPPRNGIGAPVTIATGPNARSGRIANPPPNRRGPAGGPVPGPIPGPGRGPAWGDVAKAPPPPPNVPPSAAWLPPPNALTSPPSAAWPPPPPPNAPRSAAAAAWPPPAQTSPPPARVEPPPQSPPPDSGYKVLPRSYWAGASWRWRFTRGDDQHGPQ